MSARQQTDFAQAKQKIIVIEHDFETFCELDVRQVGAFKYAQHETCDVLVLSWGTCPEDLQTWEPHKRAKMPRALLDLCNDPSVIFSAHNAQFEYCIWKYVMTRRYGAPEMPPEKFTCTAARCAASGLPRALDKVGAALDLPIKKDKEGTRLLNKFAKLQRALKPSKKNPQGVPARRILPQDDPEDFAKLVSYNRTDVLAEMQIPERVPALSTKEQRYYWMDLRMNERGIPIDMKAVQAALPVLTELERRITARVMKLTGGIRPTQRDKMLEFLNGLGLDIENLQAKTIKDMLLLKKKDLSPKQVELLQLRVEGGKASTKKLKKIQQVVCDDGRVRGAFLIYGAHTLRWAGRLIQPQNFTRGEYKPHQLELLFELLLLKDPDVLELLYEWPIDAIAQGMRGFIHAALGRTFYVSDFTAIEARILAWLANETEVLKIYEANGDVYIRMASKLYKIPETVLLQKCKVEEDPAYLLKRKFAKDIVLGCGYQMGGPGFYRNCIMRGVAVKEEECVEAVKVYRAEHPHIVKFWGDVERCAIAAVKQERTKEDPVRLRNLSFYLETIGKHTWLCIGLPSGRPMRYNMPRVQRVMRFEQMRDQLSYRTEVKGQWVRESTYGGKLVENITQAVARDVLVEAMYRAEQAGYEIIGTVHDEIIAENDPFFADDKGLDAILRIKSKWCATAPINAEGFVSPRYRK